MKEPIRCTRCILPETFPGIELDDQGECSYCSNQKRSAVLGEAKLKEVLASETGRTYDCVVPINGGKDSTYVLYYAVKVLGLRALAINYDSGFQSELARDNARSVSNVLDVPLVVLEADYETHVTMLKEILRVSEIAGTFFHVCMNCEVNIRTSAINSARQYNVPFILYGSSRFESIGNHDFLGKKAFMKRIPKRRVPELSFHLAKYSVHSIRQRIQMKVPLRSRFSPIRGVPFPEQKPRIIYFFDYVEWNSMDKVSFLREALGWKSPGAHDDRFDCLLHCFGNHHWLQACGVSVDGFTYSNMVRGTRMKRDDALRKEKAVVERTEEDCQEVLKRLGLEDYQMPRI